MDESNVEQAALSWFESLGYDTARGASISPGGEQPLREGYEAIVLTETLASSLRRINPDLPGDAIEQAVRIATRPPHPTVEQNNRWFQKLLWEGIDVEYRLADGTTRGDKVWLIEFDAGDVYLNNDFMVVSQFTVKQGDDVRRPDLVVFVNGLPIAVIELKDPTDEQATIWKAYDQLQDYKRVIPDLFVYNVLLAISDGVETRTGSLTAARDRFAPWRDLTDDRHPGQPSLEALISSLFPPAMLLDYIQNCVTFEEDERTGEIVKKIAAYHQFRAVRKTRSSVIGTRCRRMRGRWARIVCLCGRFRTKRCR